MKTVRFIFLISFILLTANVLFANQADNATRRFGLFIGSNNGGRERVTLRYAVTDARSMVNVFSEMGGISGKDAVLLVDPTIRDINNSIDSMHRQVLSEKGNNKRTEIIFYYSGHSDDEGLLLNREKYSYRSLRDKINSIPSDMRIVILDSCASGAFTRLKGGDKTMPFLIDSSFTAEGYAFLTSSSENEVSQESDRIAASYFTHSIVAGLRGAADSVGDGRVTLNELYRYAYAETLARTETSRHGKQHPSYDIQISGTGDLVLTDVNQTSASLAFEESLTGRLSIRNSRDHLIVELTKTERPLELGLEPGFYSIILQQGSDLLRAEVTLTEGKRAIVTRNNFVRIGTEPTRRRGDDAPNSLPQTTLYTFFFNVAYEPFSFPLIGFFNLGMGSHKTFQAGFINRNMENFEGFQAGFVNTVAGNRKGFQAGFVNLDEGDSSGFQAGFINRNMENFEGFQAGFVNTDEGDSSGFQAGYVNTVRGNFSGFQAGFVNTSLGETRGVQAGFVNTSKKEMTGPQFGFVNIASKNINGIQIGFVNYAESINGIPIGFISIVKNGGYQAVEFSYSEFFSYNLTFKAGIDKFYTSFHVSYNQKDEFYWENVAQGMGIGSMFLINKIFYSNIELFFTQLFNNGFITYTSFVTDFGINLGKLSIAAGPSATWVNSMSDGGGKLYDGYKYISDGNNNYVMPEPSFSLRTFNINENNMIVIGARVAARVRF